MGENFLPASFWITYDWKEEKHYNTEGSPQVADMVFHKLNEVKKKKKQILSSVSGMEKCHATVQNGMNWQEKTLLCNFQLYLLVFTVYSYRLGSAGAWIELWCFLRVHY